jgi:plastocyanin
MACLVSQAKAQTPQQSVDVNLHLVDGHQSSPHDKRSGHLAPAVAWLKPFGSRNLPFPNQNSYVLLQKKRMFTPHILVVPVGSVVRFPNADPFFHNVFSLFDGKRFDLGLYEAGSTKEVTFSREGLSYIFCNIHPEMSAVVISLSTPLYAIANANGEIKLHNVPPGEYELHVWVEGEMQPALEELTRRVHVGSSEVDLGEITLATSQKTLSKHENKFGQPYDQSQKPVY